MSLFTVNVELINGQVEVIPYTTIDELLNDIGLKALFETQLVGGCSVYCGEKRITSHPQMTWGRLREQIVANSVVILERRLELLP